MARAQRCTCEEPVRELGADQVPYCARCTKLLPDADSLGRVQTDILVALVNRIESNSKQLKMLTAEVAGLRSQFDALAADRPAGLVGVKTVATMLGTSVDYVYDHAEELGGRKLLGSGKRRRWKFDHARVRELHREARALKAGS